MNAQIVKPKAWYLNFHFLRVLAFIALTFSYMIIFTYHGKPILTNAIDGTFHVERILSLSDVWVSPANFEYFNHNGTVMSLFYPWLVVYPMYLFMKLTGNILWGYYIYCLLMTYLTLEISYFVGKKLTNKNNIAIMFAIFYSFALVRTTNLYCRFALGEVIAMTFLPLVLLGIYQVFYAKQPKFWWLTIGMTFVIYTHMISFFISFLLVGFFLIARLCERQLTKARLIALGKAIGITILLTLAFFVPILQMYATTQIEPPLEYNLMDTAENIADMIIKSLNNQVDGSDVLGMIGLVLLVVVLCRFTKLKGFYRDSAIIGIIFTILCTKLVPWNLVGPIFKVVQFPWRFLVVTTLIFCLLGPYVIANWAKPQMVRTIFILFTVAVLGIHFATMQGVRGGNDNAGISDDNFLYDIHVYMAEFNGAGDYRPKDTNTEYGELLTRQVKIGDTWQKPAKLKYNATTITYTINNQQSKHKSAILPVWSYPGEVVMHNGKKIKAKRSYNGATTVPLVKGKNVYQIHYEYTPLARTSMIVSLLSAISFVGLAFYQRRK